MTQEQALSILKSGRNVFLTGSAGTGKTYVLNQYIDYLKERKVPVAITASTGIAATHMNGMTIHAWAGIGVKNVLTSSNLRTLKTKKYLEKKLDKVKVLIIDEISMLHQNQLSMVNQVVQYFKMNSLPFGGIQVVFCGDFFQLPPVGNDSSKEKFAFMSPSWVHSDLSVCYLSQQFRQSDDQLNGILNEIRSGKISEFRLDQLQSALNNKVGEQETTKLFTHNMDVDRINSEELAKLEAKSKFFGAETKGNEKLLEGLKRSVLAMEEIELKVGAKVMFVRNNPEKGVVNGSLGEVIDFDDEEGNFPLVRLIDDRIVIASPEEWKIQEETGTTLANFKQVPLRLAWAITVHKSQGMTLDAAEIDLSKTFEKGQGYVALSRLKKLENLVLKGINSTALQVDSLAYKADKRFQELSSQVSKEYVDEQKLKEEAIAFVKNCGGITSNKEIKKQKGKLKTKSTGDSTYALTWKFLKQNLPIKEISKERGLAETTIAGHLIKVKKDNPEHNFSYYKPSSSIFNKVEKAYKKHKTKEGVSLKSIFEELNGKVSYEDIRLAVAFV